MGGEITWRCLQDSTYEFTLKLYQDCNGCNPLTQPCQGFTLPFGGGLGTTLDIDPPLPGPISQMTMNYISHKDITPKCDSNVLSRCEDPVSNYPYGIREFLYRDTMVIPAGSYRFSHESVMRNGAITTIVNPAATPWYFYAQMDSAGGLCNTSPVLLNPPQLIICVDSPFLYNPGAFDVDGDSLYFTLIDCMYEKDSAVDYLGGFSATAPISTDTTIILDPVTGTISFTPTQQEVGILCLKVEEFRLGVKIGEIVRDIQVIISNDCWYGPANGAINVSACNSYTSPSGNYTWTSSGTYLDTLLNTAGCDSTFIIFLTIVSVDTSVTQSGTLLSSNASGAVYQWLNCDSGNAVIAGETNQNFTATNNGRYAVQVSRGVCTDTSACYEVTGIGILKNDFGAVLRVYPNPTIGQLNIDLGHTYRDVSIITLNLLGEIFSSEHFSLTQQLSIDLVGPKGFYFIEIQTGEGMSAMLKVLKE